MDDLAKVFERVSRYFALLSEPMRIRVLHSICQDEKTVSEVVQETGGTQANISRHLSTMYQAGVLTRRKQGSFIYYGVADTALTEICRTVCVHIASSMEQTDTATERTDLMQLAQELQLAELRREQTLQAAMPGAIAQGQA
jgi:DNA-binding transcriptional ArsR family regulator